MVGDVVRALITGGAGFLGSHLAERLLASGTEVVCLDDFSTGSRRNVAHLLGDPRFTLLEHDVTVPLDIEVDRIYNLASPASPMHYQRDPVRTITTNVVGAITMLDLAARRGIPILQASTSEVYGDPGVHPQPESYWGNVNPIGPRSCYDEGKRSAETVFFDYHRQHGVDIKVMRIFNTYGPRMDINDGRVVSTFIRQALLSEPITIHGSGTQSRSFCYVDDLIEAMVRLMATGPTVTGPVNVGNPVEVTMRELAEEVLRITGSGSGIEFTTRPVDDPSRRCPDISLARHELDWEPEVALSVGLERTVDHVRRLMAA